MSSAVVVIDVQNCFLPGGPLATANERNSTLPASALAKSIARFIGEKNPAKIFITQDWHPEGHASFARSNKGEIPVTTMPLNAPGIRKRNGEYVISTNINYIRYWGSDEERSSQKLWPKHCVKDTDDAKLAPELEEYLQNKQNVQYIYKGDEPTVDSYSAVANALGNPTPHTQDGESFLKILKESQLKEIYLTGIARDVCVYWSAMDMLNYWILPAYKAGNIIKLYFVYDLTRPVYGSLPTFNKTKEEIQIAVLDLIKNMEFSDPENVYNQVFEIMDSGKYFAEGGRRSTKKARKNKKSKKAKKTRKNHVHTRNCKKSCRR